MGATVHVGCWDGSGQTNHDVTSGTGSVSYSQGIAYNDTATPITLPGSGSRNFSALRWLGIFVTAGGVNTVHLQNLRVSMSAANASGLNIHSVAVASGSYAQANTTQGSAAGNIPAADSVVTDLLTTDSRFTGGILVSTTPTVYDSTGALEPTTSATTVTGKYLMTSASVDYRYVQGGGGGNLATNFGVAGAATTITFTYDEA